ncbi:MULTISPECIES: hypothetical protein [unclassified Paenibacillus]|uniref:hypothetical protein n=1 Tax=unclassified Paenibacillus TaxID=185978 RepID=UPI000BA6CFEA|nr:hypothetical protein [Paenibacillus sp. 7541]PAK48860.1 hypothetical protein CHH75_21925 [Paenibacillus sp. 7541]
MMSRLEQEQTAKIAMISSIASSQQALASILGSIADIAEHSDITARQLAENIRVLTAYQSVMTEMLTGISLNRIKTGSPAAPWLSSACGPERRAAAEHH